MHEISVQEVVITPFMPILSYLDDLDMLKMAWIP